MKVALLYKDAFAPGGYPRDVRWLAGALSSHQVEVSVLGRPGALRDGLGAAEVVDDPKRWAGAAHSADLLHAFGLSDFDQLKALMRLRSRSGRLVLSPLAHLMGEHVRIAGWKKRPAYQVIGRVLSGRNTWAHYFSGREALESNRYLPSPRYFIAPVGVFPADASASEEGGPGEHLLFFGRNDVHQKGLDILVRGYERAVAAGLRSPLVIGGRPHGASQAFLDEAARRSNGRIRIVGGVDDRERSRLMQRARAFVFLSRWDGPPRPIREALAVGAPLIVSPGTNMGELVTEHEAGSEVTEDSLVAALHLADDDATVSRWRAGAARLREALSWHKVSLSFVEGYERCLAE